MVNPEDEKPKDQDVEAPGEETVPLVEIKTGKESNSNAGGANGSAAVSTKVDQAVEFVGLTKDELEQFANDPFWKRLRMILFILFWLVWLAMLVAVIVIIVVSPKCPPRPQREFWQKPFYRVQVQSFAPESVKDNKPDQPGTLAGLKSKLPYIRDQLGINNIMIDSMLARDADGCIADFKSFNKRVGSYDGLRDLNKLGRKKGFTVMMDLDASQAASSLATKINGTIAAASVSDSGNVKNRAGTPAVQNGKLQTPIPKCDSLNVSAPAVVQMLQDAMRYWLDAGLSGFVLTNVAFVMPGAGGEKVGDYGLLFSNASVKFVQDMRAFIDAEADRLGRPLALFVDFGDVGMPFTDNTLEKYSNAASSIIETRSTSLSAGNLGLKRYAKYNDKIAIASNWFYTTRNNHAAVNTLMLTFPSVPIVYYGQELGMEGMAGVSLNKSLVSSADYASDATDANQSPMQWGGSTANAGWLKNTTQSLLWVNGLKKRADDIFVHNLQKLNSSGHPDSPLQLFSQLIELRSSIESLQWGELTLLRGSDYIWAYQRKAERFPSVIVLINAGVKTDTITLPQFSAKGELKLSYPSGGARHSYKLGESYKLNSLYIPGNTVLVFLADDA